MDIKAGVIQIENDLLEQITKDINTEKTNINNILKKTITNQFNNYPKAVVDTGNLRKNSQVEIKKSKQTHTITLYTDLSSVPYAIYPYYGLGTSAKYGDRPYLEDAAKNWIKTLSK